MLIVTDQKWNKLFCEWIAKRMHPVDPDYYLDPHTTRTLALIDAEVGEIAREENVLTVVALNHWTQHTIEGQLATNGAKRPKTSRAFNWTVFDYVFNHCGKSRFNTYVRLNNHKSIAVQHMLGMKQECILKDHFGPGEDGIFFGLTKADWLNGPWRSPEEAPS